MSVQKTYIENIVVIGTMHGNIKAWINANSLMDKIYWEQSGSDWKMIDCVYCDWVRQNTVRDRYNHQFRICNFNLSLGELIIEMTLRGVEVYNGMTKQGKFSDADWELLKSLKQKSK